MFVIFLSERVLANKQTNISPFPGLHKHDTNGCYLPRRWRTLSEYARTTKTQPHAPFIMKAGWNLEGRHGSRQTGGGRKGGVGAYLPSCRRRRPHGYKAPSIHNSHQHQVSNHISLSHGFLLLLLLLIRCVRAWASQRGV